MTRRRGWFALAGIVMALAACSSPSGGGRTGSGQPPAGLPFAGEPSGAPQSGGTFRMALPGDVPTMDPAQAGFDFASWSMTIAVHSALVDYDTAVKLQGDLAQTWEVSPDGRSYTFHLRPEAAFSDGSPLTSADVAFTLQRTLDPKTASPGAYLFSGIEGAGDFTSGKATTVSGITTPNPATVDIRLQAPEPYFLNVLAMPYARVMSAKQVTKYGETISQHPLGSGPFMLKDWAAGQRIALTRNPHYFLPGRPYLNDVQVDLNVNDQTRVLEYQRGDLSITDIPSAAYSQLALNAESKRYLVTNKDASTYYVGMKNQVKPFDDARVRQALNYAVNKQRLVQLLNGRAVVSHGVVPPPLPGYSPDAKGYNYDVNKAKDLLAQAGYKNGFETEIWTINDDQSTRMVQAIVQDLAAVNVKVSVRAMNSSTFYAGVGKSDQAPMFFTFWLQDYPDAYDFFSNLLLKANWGTTNTAYYSNPQVEADVAQMAHDTSSKRAQMIADVDRRVTSDAPWVFLYHTNTQHVHQPNTFYYIHPVHLWRFADYWVKP